MMFTKAERALITKLSTPARMQRFLRTLPYNFETSGESLMSCRAVLRNKRAHCLEAALTAAAILETHGYPPLLMDLESVDLLDHVLFVFRGEDGRWGSIGRSRDPGLHGRKPVFASLRALAESYVLPYIDYTGRIRGFGLMDLRDLKSCDWRFSQRNVWQIERALNDNRHTRLATDANEHALWHARYVAYKKRYPDRRPTYYPNRHHWL